MCAVRETERRAMSLEGLRSISCVGRTIVHHYHTSPTCHGTAERILAVSHGIEYIDEEVLGRKSANIA